MIKGYQKKITSIYEEIQENEKKALRKRKEEIALTIPEVPELENKIQRLSISLPMSILKGIPEEELNSIREEITSLRERKYELLTSHGYSMDYLSLHYQCAKCKDTGYIGNKKCSCYKNKLVDLYYKTSELENCLRTCNFKNFNIDLFSSNYDNNHKFTQKKNMERIYEFIIGSYIPNFSKENSNLLFYGESGTGKTFLSWCIAKELLDQGFLVIYKTSDELIKDLRSIALENNSTLQDLLINCDLLIIDDLGAEQVTDFATNELFNLINKKLLNNKKMLISTNLNLLEISNIYTTRLYSRLLGNFKLVKFYGDDVRIKLNIAKRK